MNYTKGDWKVVDETCVYIGELSKSTKVIAETANHIWADRPNAKESEANAHLIASAPAMYEALQYFIKLHATEYSELNRGIGTSTEHGIRMLRARNALAKAEGK